MIMIALKELNPKNYKLDKIQEDNIQILLYKMNQVRILYNNPMLITSGVRTIDDQIRIYKDKGITDISKIPMKSMHLVAAACDVLDLDGKLMKWCHDNVHHLEAIGLWIEDDTSVPRVHFQIFSPASQSRFFKP